MSLQASPGHFNPLGPRVFPKEWINIIVFFYPGFSVGGIVKKGRHYWQWHMLGQVATRWDLPGDVESREGWRVMFVIAFPKHQEGYQAYTSYSWASPPSISDHQDAWATFDSDQRFYSKEAAFYFLRQLHNHIIQTSVLIGKSIRFHFSRESNGVQEARWWCCLGPPPREIHRYCWVPRYSTSSSQSWLWVLCPASLLSAWLSLRYNWKSMERRLAEVYCHGGGAIDWVFAYSLGQGREGDLISFMTSSSWGGTLNPAIQRVRLHIQTGSGKSFLPQHLSLLIMLLCGGARQRCPLDVPPSTSSLTVPLGCPVAIMRWRW